MLPYSVNEIYGFRKSGKFHEARQTYNEIYHLYGEISEQSKVCPQYVLTEDSNSGYEFFSSLFKQSNISCAAANGKSNIIFSLQKMDPKEGILLNRKTLKPSKNKLDIYRKSLACTRTLQSVSLWNMSELCPA